MIIAVMLLALLSCSKTRNPAAVPQATDEEASSIAATVDSLPAANFLPINRIIEMRTPDGERTALIHHPRSARQGAAVIIALHPAATSASAMEEGFGWDTIADRDGLVVVYPEGLLDSFQDTWNGGRCCPPASQLHTDDVGFLNLLVTAVRQLDGVGSKVFAVGFSNGAIMAYAWACADPGELAGIGVVAGALLTDCAKPSPLTVVAVHGTADTSIPLTGGVAADGTRFPSVEESLAPFHSAADCPAKATVLETKSVTISDWTCAHGRTIVSDVITGLGHAWPGAGETAGTDVGPLDATGFLWAHLSGDIR